MPYKTWNSFYGYLNQLVLELVKRVELFTCCHLHDRIVGVSAGVWQSHVLLACIEMCVVDCIAFARWHEPVLSTCRPPRRNDMALCEYHPSFWQALQALFHLYDGRISCCWSSISHFEYLPFSLLATCLVIFVHFLVGVQMDMQCNHI